MAKKKKQRVGICHNPACPMCDVEQFFDEGQELKCSCCPEPLEEIVVIDDDKKGESTKTFLPWKRIGIVGIALALLVAIVWFIFFRDPKPIHLEITLSKENITLNVGDNEILTVSITTMPEKSNVSVSYISDNISVARVDNQGTVHAVSKGEANITVIAQTETGIADTAWAKVNVEKQPELTPPIMPTPKEISYGWYTWNGKHIDGKPHGKGTMKVTQTHTINLVDITGSKITVYPGETIIAMFDHGRLRGGDIIHKDGSSTTFSNNL